MLDTDALLLLRAETYLSDVLGGHVALRLTEAPAGLPHFLRDGYAVARGELLGQPAMVLGVRDAAAFTPSEARRHLDQFARAAPGAIVVFLFSALDAFQRRQLITHRMPFVVPGNQLFLPQLALDLRERFAQAAPLAPDAAFSPATQALLIIALLRERWRPEWAIEQDAARLGYTAMTVTRAVRELETGALIQTTMAGRKRHVRFEAAPGDVWASARARLRNPVRREILVSAAFEPPVGALRAGETALGELTSLADAGLPVWAVEPADWRAASERGATAVKTREGTQAWQVWIYGPQLHLPGRESRRTVDPLSLMLSLARATDERIQLALEELKGHVPWPMGET